MTDQRPIGDLHATLGMVSSQIGLGNLFDKIDLLRFSSSSLTVPVK